MEKAGDFEKADFFIIIDRISYETVGAGMILDRQTSETRKDHWMTSRLQKHWLGLKVRFRNRKERQGLDSNRLRFCSPAFPVRVSQPRPTV